MIQYPALFEPDASKGGFVLDFEWGVTQGETEAEATEMAKDALLCIIEETIRKRQDLPKPSRVRGKKYREISLPALVDDEGPALRSNARWASSESRISEAYGDSPAADREAARFGTFFPAGAY